MPNNNIQPILTSDHTKGHHPIELVYTEEYETPRESHLRER